jgi:G:T-mismatch repair DNA endonuclease (very short patch repair protein)
MYEMARPITDAEARKFWFEECQKQIKRTKKAERKLRKLRKLLASE